MPQLYQTDFWTDREGVVHHIANMDTPYLANVINYLDRRADGIQLREIVKLSATVPSDPSDGVADFFDQAIAELQEPPLEWLHQTPLYRALVAERDGRLSHKIKTKLKKVFHIV